MTAGTPERADTARGWLPDRIPDDAAPPLLNLGCGEDYRPGWVNVDRDPTGRLDVDRRFDIFEVPWPLESSSVGLVYMRHVLEHVPHRIDGVDGDGFFAVTGEIHRVLRPGAYAYFRTPHWEDIDVVKDPTHTRAVHPHNFRYLDPGYKFGYYTDTPFRLVEARPSGWSLWGRRLPRAGASGLTVTEHLWERAPILRPLLRRRPCEMTYVLQKIPTEAPPSGHGDPARA